MTVSPDQTAKPAGRAAFFHRWRRRLPRSRRSPRSWRILRNLLAAAAVLLAVWIAKGLPAASAEACFQRMARERLLSSARILSIELLEDYLLIGEGQTEDYVVAAEKNGQYFLAFLTHRGLLNWQPRESHPTRQPFYPLEPPDQKGLLALALPRRFNTSSSLLVIGGPENAVSARALLTLAGSADVSLDSRSGDIREHQERYQLTAENVGDRLYFFRVSSKRDEHYAGQLPDKDPASILPPFDHSDQFGDWEYQLFSEFNSINNDISPSGLTCPLTVDFYGQDGSLLASESLTIKQLLAKQEVNIREN